MPGGIRTPDPRLRRPLLYPTELQTRKAGDGNRTHVSSLEGWCSTIELHPRKVEVTGFEPAASWSQTRRSTKLSHTSPYPVTSQQMPVGFVCHPKRKINYMADKPPCQHIFLFFSQIPTIQSQGRYFTGFLANENFRLIPESGMFLSLFHVARLGI